jgi:hypothetical protein
MPEMVRKAKTEKRIFLLQKKIGALFIGLKVLKGVYPPSNNPQ